MKDIRMNKLFIIPVCLIILAIMLLLTRQYVTTTSNSHIHEHSVSMYDRRCSICHKQIVETLTPSNTGDTNIDWYMNTMMTYLGRQVTYVRTERHDIDYILNMAPELKESYYWHPCMVLGDDNYETDGVKVFYFTYKDFDNTEKEGFITEFITHVRDYNLPDEVKKQGYTKYYYEDTLMKFNSVTDCPLSQYYTEFYNDWTRPEAYNWKDNMNPLGYSY